MIDVGIYMMAGSLLIAFGCAFAVVATVPGPNSKDKTPPTERSQAVIKWVGRADMVLGVAGFIVAVLGLHLHVKQ